MREHPYNPHSEEYCNWCGATITKEEIACSECMKEMKKDFENKLCPECKQQRDIHKDSNVCGLCDWLS